MSDEIHVTTNDPEAMREQIEVTRARMSETIDEIEDALLRKKEQIQDRLDVLEPVRSRPLPALGGALAAGLVLGLLTGGDDDEEYEVEYSRSRSARAHLGDPEMRARMWEARARRLLRIAREQEARLEDPRHGGFLVAGYADADGRYDSDDEDLEVEVEYEYEGGSGSRIQEIVGERIIGLLGRALTRWLRS